MGVGLVALVIAVAAGIALSVLKSRYDGRFRPVHPNRSAAQQEARSAGEREAGAVVGREDSSRVVVGAEGGTAAGREYAEAGGQRRQSGVRDESAEAGERLTADELGGALGERATLVQFSSAFCAPCRATHRILADVAGMVDGVRHLELDAESNLELVRRLDILRTPTVLVLDADGALVTRASGQPRKADVIAAVGKAVPDAA